MTGILMTGEEAKAIETSRKVFLATLITEEQIHSLASEFGIEYAIVRAIMEVEGGQLSYYPGTYDPIVLFESQWFHKFTKGVYDKDYPTLSTPKANYALYKLNQRNRIKAAFALDNEASLMSASWGCMQVMGFNYRLVGYKDIWSFTQDMFISQYFQVKAGLTYIKNAGLLGYARLHQWDIVAYRYNGENYKKNAYDTKLEKAYKKWNELEKKVLASVNTSTTSTIAYDTKDIIDMSGRTTPMISNTTN